MQKRKKKPEHSAPKLTQEQRCLGHIRWIRQPAQWHIAKEILHTFWCKGDADKGLEQTGATEQRQEAVDADLLRAVLGREAFRRLFTTHLVSSDINVGSHKHLALMHLKTSEEAPQQRTSPLFPHPKRGGLERSSHSQPRPY